LNGFSNLTEDEILEKYRSIIGDYMPFIILPSAFGEVRDEYRRNEKKFQIESNQKTRFLQF